MFSSKIVNALVVLFLMAPHSAVQAMRCPEWLRSWANKVVVPLSWRVTIATQDLSIHEGWMEGISPAGSTLALSDQDGVIWLHDAENLRNVSQVPNLGNSWVKGLFFADEETLFLGRESIDSSGEDFDLIVLDAFKWTKGDRAPFKSQEEIHLRLPKGAVEETVYVRGLTNGAQNLLDVEYRLVSGEQFVDRFEVPGPRDLFALGSRIVKLVPKYHLVGSRFLSSLQIQRTNHFTQIVDLGTRKQKREFQIYQLGSEADGSDARLERYIQWATTLSVERILLSADHRTAFVSVRDQGLFKIRLTGVEKGMGALLAEGVRLAPPLGKGLWHDLSACPEAGIFLVSSPNRDKREIRSLQDGALLGRLDLESPISTPDGSRMADLTQSKRGWRLTVFTLQSLLSGK